MTTSIQVVGLYGWTRKGEISRFLGLNVLCRNYRSHNRYEVSINGNQEMLQRQRCMQVLFWKLVAE